MSSIGKIRRLLQLLERLQSGRIHSTADLAELCGVSRRTVFRDIKTLQDAGVQVRYDASQQGYWISTKAYLPPTQLTLAETLSLIVLAHDTGSGSRSIPFQEPARDAALKLASNLPSYFNTSAHDLCQSVHVQTEPLADLSESTQHYDHLLRGITERRKVRVVYRSLAEQSVIRTLISPYKLLFRRHTWYVIGRSSLHRSVRTFHLGRVGDSQMTSDSFEIPPRFSLKAYFGNAWNLIREPNARVDVTVRFQPLVATNVAEVCWHPTQRLVWNDDGTMDFTVTVDGIHEMSWWILSYGDQAQALSPPAMIQLLQRRAKNMVKSYKSQRKSKLR